MTTKETAEIRAELDAALEALHAGEDRVARLEAELRERARAERVEKALRQAAEVAEKVRLADHVRSVDEETYSKIRGMVSVRAITPEQREALEAEAARREEENRRG